MAGTQGCRARRRLVWHAFAALVCAVAVGCGQPATKLTGTVKLDGQPLARALVQFVPERRDGPTALAITDADGRYLLPVKAVPFRVTIAKQRIVGQKPDDTNPNGGLMDVHEEIVPKQYGDLTKTPLRANPVEAAVTTVDFSLTGGSFSLSKYHEDINGRE